ncbi:MAG: rhodanese-like domain-containing protein [Planctomycetota bacterium]|jgi:rhodanese-related sulfurtransferase
MVAQISPRDLYKSLENGQDVRLIDVRQPWENQLANLPNSVLIPLNELPQRAQEIVRDQTVVVVYCHHGIRSLSAAGYLQRLGFINVKSLAGGIDAWSCEIDHNIPRY